ncbi:MAG TPA: hypothetical protein VF796_18895 [Humisphaera sp.]
MDTPPPSTGPGGLPWPAVILGILTLLYATVVRPLRKKKQQQADPLSRAPSNSARTLLAQQRAVEREMTSLLVEYEGMMRTMSAHLETRVAKLEVLLADADKTINELRAEKAALLATGPGDGAAAGRTTAVPSGPAGATAADDRIAPPDPTATCGSTPLPPASADDSGAGFDVPPEEPTAESPGDATPPDAEPAVEPSHAEVYALADEGLTYRQIAQRLDRQYGEIELILALRPKPATPAAIAAPPAAVVEKATAPAAATLTPPQRDEHSHRHGHKHRKKHR